MTDSNDRPRRQTANEQDQHILDEWAILGQELPRVDIPIRCEGKINPKDSDTQGWGSTSSQVKSVMFHMKQSFCRYIVLPLYILRGMRVNALVRSLLYSVARHEYR